jgi:hypothetical protein
MKDVSVAATFQGWLDNLFTDIGFEITASTLPYMASSCVVIRLADVLLAAYVHLR